MAEEGQGNEGKRDCPWSILVLGWTCGNPCVVYNNVSKAGLPFRRLHQQESLWGHGESFDIRTYVISRPGMEELIQRYFTEDQRWLQWTSVTSTWFESLDHALSMSKNRSSSVTIPSLFTYKIVEHHHAEGPFMWHSLSDILQSTGLHVKKTIEAINHFFDSGESDDNNKKDARYRNNTCERVAFCLSSKERRTNGGQLKQYSCGK
jgi:hypothetical protein